MHLREIERLLAERTVHLVGTNTQHFVHVDYIRPWVIKAPTMITTTTTTPTIQPLLGDSNNNINNNNINNDNSDRKRYSTFSTQRICLIGTLSLSGNRSQRPTSRTRPTSFRSSTAASRANSSASRSRRSPIAFSTMPITIPGAR